MREWALEGCVLAYLFLFPLEQSGFSFDSGSFPLVSKQVAQSLKPVFLLGKPVQPLGESHMSSTTEVSLLWLGAGRQMQQQHSGFSQFPLRCIYHKMRSHVWESYEHCCLVWLVFLQKYRKNQTLIMTAAGGKRTTDKSEFLKSETQTHCCPFLSPTPHLFFLLLYPLMLWSSSFWLFYASISSSSLSSSVLCISPGHRPWISIPPLILSS